MPSIRRSRRRRPRPQPEIPLERIEQGQGGERALQDWLDRSRLAYLFLDQTPFTIPAALRADLKRPDFVVAIAGTGPVAVDAKAKAFIDGCFVLDASERRRHDGFESHFTMPVWYACFPPAEPRLCYLFRNRALMGPCVFHDSARQIIRAPVKLGFAVERASTTFPAALARADDAPRVMPALAALDPFPFERRPAVGPSRR
jgi:hypothetical protein